MSRPTVDPTDTIYKFEHYPPDEEMDETGRAVRSYVAQIPKEKLAQYRDDWTDEQVLEWDDNFRSDGNLFLVCAEADVDVAEFRRVLHLYFDFCKAKG